MKWYRIITLILLTATLNGQTDTSNALAWALGGQVADLESQQWLGIPAVERDRYWEPRNALELWNKLNGITVEECGCKSMRDGTVFSPCEAHQEVEAIPA